ncbi:hypothetical protein HYX58_03215 [Candidatus Dependentiae bacterium]|nr:hypothetical protein [Candidatus Dependentiae bacterium]
MKFLSVLFMILSLTGFSLNAMEGAKPAYLYKEHFQAQIQTTRTAFKAAIENAKKENQIISEDALLAVPELQQDTIQAQLSALKDNAKNNIIVSHAGQKNAIAEALYKELSKKDSIASVTNAPKDSIDILIAPHSLYSEMQSIFNASEKLLATNGSSIEQHPLFNYFAALKKDGVFVISLLSGPTIQNFTDLLLGKHDLELSKAHAISEPNVKIFNNVETFFRCLDIFKRYYEEKTSNTINCDLSFSSVRTPLKTFCEALVKQYPELKNMNAEQLEPFIRLLAVFNINQVITDLNITLKLSLKPKSTESKVSFKPIGLNLESSEQSNSNDISFAQQNLDKQIQNLDGSELSMPYIKDADGAQQFKAMKSILGRKKINYVDIGGGRGETNAVVKALQDSGSEVNVLSIEPYVPFAELYKNAYKAIDVKNVHVIQKTAQDVTVKDITDYFNNEKADVVYASHSFYFILQELHKAAQESIYGSAKPLNQHPLWKYFDMLNDKGVLVVTLQSGAGARLFRNALMGNHGLSSNSANDEIVSLLSSFGNLATFLRHFEFFAKQYEKETGKKITIKMHHAVANVPLGDFLIDKDSKTNAYTLKDSSNKLASKMLDFYGNWKELQTTASSTIENNNDAQLAKQENARKMQETFLHILRIFALNQQNMQHPNITLEITVE